MSKLTERISKASSKLGSVLRWPKRTLSVPEKRQVARWEGEGGSVRDDAEQTEQ